MQYTLRVRNSVDANEITSSLYFSPDDLCIAEVMWMPGPYCRSEGEGLGLRSIFSGCALIGGITTKYDGIINTRDWWVAPRLRG